ncbi:MAG: YggS family pyridoxal phosphate-dependent enzyme, partial [Desulfocucumaceae bacterium]
MVSENIVKLRGEIARAALAAGRNPADITVVAVTKYVPVETITMAIGEGIADLGENRGQEFLGKQQILGPDIRWHIIGHLQTNKVRAVVGKVNL